MGREGSYGCGRPFNSTTMIDYAPCTFVQSLTAPLCGAALAEEVRVLVPEDLYYKHILKLPPGTPKLTERVRYWTEMMDGTYML